MDDLPGKIWSEWGALSDRDRRRISRRHPRLARLLAATTREVDAEHAAAWAGLRRFGVSQEVAAAALLRRRPVPPKY